MLSRHHFCLLLLALVAACGASSADSTTTDTSSGEDLATATDVFPDLTADMVTDSVTDAATDLVSPEEVQIDADEVTEVDGGVNQEAFAALAEVIEAKRLEKGAPGLAVAILLDGKLAWSKGFGTKHPDGGEPILPTTLFRIGSITKVMTAIGLLQQQEAGCLDVSDRLVDHLEGFTMNAGAYSLKVGPKFRETIHPWGCPNPLKSGASPVGITR